AQPGPGVAADLLAGAAAAAPQRRDAGRARARGGGGQRAAATARPARVRGGLLGDRGVAVPVGGRVMPDSDGAAAVRRFYETYGWQRGPSGAYRDAEAFVDLRPVMRGYHRRRDRRVARQLAGPGPLLDIGCGGA